MHVKSNLILNSWIKKSSGHQYCNVGSLRQTSLLVLLLETVNKWLLSRLTDFARREKTHPLFKSVSSLQYQDWWNTDHNEMKNTCMIYIVSQVLKAFHVKSCYNLRIRPTVFIFIMFLFRKIIKIKLVPGLHIPSSVVKFTHQNY